MSFHPYNFIINCFLLVEGHLVRIFGSIYLPHVCDRRKLSAARRWTSVGDGVVLFLCEGDGMSAQPCSAQKLTAVLELAWWRRFKVCFHVLVSSSRTGK
jgi:hypothetical protein